MRHRRSARSSLLACVLLALGCAGGTPPTATTETTAFVGANVIPMDREVVLEDHTVLVQGDRIAALGPSSDVQVPAGATRIDAAGRYLMPGIADMHVHVWNEDHLWLLLANGVTQVRNMWGAPLQQRWQAEIEAGERLAPSIYTVGPLMDGPGAFWPGSVILETPEAARAAVAEVHAAGFPAVKGYNTLSAEVYGAVVETAHDLGLRVEGHVPRAVGIEGVIAAGQIANEHLTGIDAAIRAAGSPHFGESDGLSWLEERAKASRLAARIEAGEVSIDEVYDPDKIAALAAEIADAGLWNVPTLVVFQALPKAEARRALQAPAMRFVDPATKRRWSPEADSFGHGLDDEGLRALQVWHGHRRKVVRALHEAGAGILLGSDMPNPFVVPGFSIHEELGNLVAAGLTPYEALRAGTVDAARFLEQAGKWGAVTPGGRADLVLLDANPLADVAAAARPVGVMVRGLWLSADDLEARLEALATRYVAVEDFFDLVAGGDLEAAREMLAAQAAADGDPAIGEAEINRAGYLLLGQKRTQDAIEIFLLNTRRYPDSGNVWDSLAEAYMADGQTEKAIENYERSLEVDPDNRNAVAKLEELRGDS